jgi:hypothetical protein
VRRGCRRRRSLRRATRARPGVALIVQRPSHLRSRTVGAHKHACRRSPFLRQAVRAEPTFIGTRSGTCRSSMRPRPRNMDSSTIAACQDSPTAGGSVAFGPLGTAQCPITQSNTRNLRGSSARRRVSQLASRRASALGSVGSFSSTRERSHVRTPTAPILKQRLRVRDVPARLIGRRGDGPCEPCAA